MKTPCGLSTHNQILQLCSQASLGRCSRNWDDGGIGNCNDNLTMTMWQWWQLTTKSHLVNHWQTHSQCNDTMESAPHRTWIPSCESQAADVSTTKKDNIFAQQPWQSTVFNWKNAKQIEILCQKDSVQCQCWFNGACIHWQQMEWVFVFTIFSVRNSIHPLRISLKGRQSSATCVHACATFLISQDHVYFFAWQLDFSQPFPCACCWRDFESRLDSIGWPKQNWILNFSCNARLFSFPERGDE